MPYNLYTELSEQDNVDWRCHKCIFPQFSDSYFDSDSDISGSSSSLYTPEAAGSILEEEEEIYFREIRDLKCKHRKNVIFAHINLNSFRYKYIALQEILFEKYVDILIVAETKLDSSFPDAQF